MNKEEEINDCNEDSNSQDNKNQTQVKPKIGMEKLSQIKLWYQIDVNPKGRNPKTHEQVGREIQERRTACRIEPWLGDYSESQTKSIENIDSMVILNHEPKV